MNDETNNRVGAIRDYWNRNTLGLQYVSNHALVPGTRAFFDHIRPWMNPYKFPWIMERIDRESRTLAGRHLLEIGCGMGFDSVEFLRRGVRVTAIDLTESAVRIARQHFEVEGLKPENVQVGNALALPFPDDSFDAVWSNGVLHATGDTAQAIAEVRRVLKPGGRAMISHFYRRPSWMWVVHRLGREPIEAHEEDPPVNEFYTDEQVLAMFTGFRVIETAHEHYRALPVAKRGVKAWLYHAIFQPLYNLLPERLALRWAYKLSVVAIKE
jgi:ubiquinone/menaquinone biosynthesis C-methylase UbiE